MQANLAAKGQASLTAQRSILRTPPQLDTARTHQQTPPQNPEAQRPKRPRPGKGSDEAKEQMKRVREAQMHKFFLEQGK